VGGRFSLVVVAFATIALLMVLLMRVRFERDPSRGWKPNQRPLPSPPRSYYVLLGLGYVVLGAGVALSIATRHPLSRLVLVRPGTLLDHLWHGRFVSREWEWVRGESFRVDRLCARHGGRALARTCEGVTRGRRPSETGREPGIRLRTEPHKLGSEEVHSNRREFSPAHTGGMAMQQESWIRFDNVRDEGRSS